MQFLLRFACHRLQNNPLKRQLFDHELHSSSESFGETLKKQYLILFIFLLTGVSASATFSVPIESVPSIFSETKMEKGHFSGQRYTADRNYETVLYLELLRPKIDTSLFGIEAAWQIRNSDCKTCSHKKIKKLQLLIKDPDLKEKIWQIKNHQYSEFGKIVSLQNAQIKTLSDSGWKAQDTHCWAETDYYYSHLRNRYVNGFALSCSHSLKDLYFSMNISFQP